MKNFSLIVTVTSFFLLFSVISSSATPINNWNFDIEYGFTSYTGINEYGHLVHYKGVNKDGYTIDINFPGYGIEPSKNNSDFEAPTKLEWGQKGFSFCSGWNNIGNNSSISVTSDHLKNSIQLGNKVEGVTLQHQNNTLSSSRSTTTTYLYETTLSSKLTLTPVTSEKLEGQSWEKDFNIKFFETRNPADDVFLMDGFLNDFNYDTTANNLITEIFDMGDYTYKASFMIEDFYRLTDYKSYGFKTPEIDTTKKTTSFSIDLVSSPTKPTPEPSTLVLFGLGIVGFAGIIRKKLK